VKLPSQDRWRKWTGPLEDHQILRVIEGERGGILRGCFWAEETRYAVLDIDAQSQYHRAEKLANLLAAVENIGLAGSLYQSSDSGGWHLYIPFTQEERSSEIEHTLKRWLKALGYEIKGGQLEIFPSGNALRLPLQPGFAWLNSAGKVIQRREDLTLEQSLINFLRDQDQNARDWQTAKSRIQSQIVAADRAAGRKDQAQQKRLEMEGFEHVFSGGKNQDYWEKGRKFWQEGLSGAGQRHDAVLYIGHYLWYGDSENRIAALPGSPNDEYRAKLIEHWLKEKHNGFCRHIDQNKWEEITAQIKRAVLWRGNGQAKEYEPYRLSERLLKRLIALYRKTGKLWTVEEFEKANHDRRLEARARIAEAVVTLEDQGRLFLTFAEVARQAGAHRSTVKKNADLLTRCLGEYNRGGSGGLGAVLPSFGPEFEEEKTSVLEIETNSQTGCVLDSLRSDRAGQTAKNSRQVTTEVLAAVHPTQSNSGVKHELAGSAPSVASGGIACGINGFLPTAAQQVPSIYSSAFFSMGAPAQNLRQVGNRCDGLAYKRGAATFWGFGLSATAQVQQVDNSITLVLPLERASGYVPLSCYDKRRQRAGGRLLSPDGYIACMSSDAHEKKQEEVNRAPERQSEHVRQAQGEASNASENYTDQVKAQQQEQKVTGKSKATGAGADAYGKGGLASAKDLLGDLAHATLTNDAAKKTLTPERKAEIMADIERDGYIVGKPQDKPVLVAQGFNIPNPVEAYKQEIEHRYRGKELETMNREIPAKAWGEAYKAFPELKQIGEKDSIRLMKAIIANELEHYDPADLAQDALSKTGHAGGALKDRSIGFAQISPNGVRDMSRQLEAQVQRHERTSNPLAKFDKATRDELAEVLAKPENTPLFVAAHLSLDLKTLNRHKNEVEVTPEALGYIYNADRVYAKSDEHHEHLLTKSEARKKQIPNDTAWPTKLVLQQSEHAANIRRWLKKVL